jgi:hypothetical protein
MTLAACLRGEIPAQVDWGRVIALANQSLTTAALASTIASSGIPVPADVSEFLSEILRRNAKRNGMLMDQLGETCAALNSVGVVPVLQKGAAMLLSDGASRDARIMSDLDLIVRPADIPRAVHCLEGIGYRCGSRPGPQDRDEPILLARPQDVGMIDLHCRPRGPQRLAGDAIFQRHASPVSLGAGVGRAMLPSPTLQILYLTLHDQFHDRDLWRGHIDLRHLVDIALTAMPEGVDWDALSRIFSGRYARHAFAAQMINAERLMGVAIPADMRAGTLARLQYRRRLIQADHPPLAILFSLLTMLTEFPPRKHERDPAEPSVEKKMRRARLHLQGLFREKSCGKV